jgi:hypothetical protein
MGKRKARLSPGDDLVSKAAVKAEPGVEVKPEPQDEGNEYERQRAAM